MPFNFEFGDPFKKKENMSVAELQEREEELELRISVAQKEEMLTKLKQNGLSIKKDFGGSIKRAWAWFRSH